MLFTESYVSISQSLKLLIWAVHCRRKEGETTNIQHSEEKNFRIGGGREWERDREKEMPSAWSVLCRSSPRILYYISTETMAWTVSSSCLSI